MAASSIKNDLGKLLVDLTINKINHWAQAELTNARHTSPFPICVPMSDTRWVVGMFQLDQLGSHKWLVTRDKKQIHTFYSKQAAIFYAVLTQCHYYKIADELLAADQTTAKLSDEFEFYTARLTTKSKKPDEFKQQLRWVRYLDVKARFKASKQDLEKKLNRAKYIKIWEKIL